MAKETRTYVGETGTPGFDGWAGFRIGQTYTLDVTRLDNGDVALVIYLEDRERDMTLTQEQFDKWFKK